MTDEMTNSLIVAVEAFYNGIQDVANGILESISDILPIALPVMGAIVVIGIGVKVFKRFVK